MPCPHDDTSTTIVKVKGEVTLIKTVCNICKKILDVKYP